MTDYTHDIGFYGDHEGGIFGAVKAKQVAPGARVTLFCQTAHIDNYSTCGLGRVDIGKTWLIAGWNLLWARQIGAMYGKSKQYYFGSRRVEHYFRRLMGLFGVQVVFYTVIDRVEMTGTKIDAIVDLNGHRHFATHWGDSHRMGDLLQRVTTRGVGFRLGREARTADEPFAGFQPYVAVSNANPYVSPGQLAQGVTPYPTGRASGAADDMVQCPGVRSLVTNSYQNRLDWMRLKTVYPPDNYDLLNYFLNFQIESRDQDFNPHPVEIGKFDRNDNTIITDPVTGRPDHFDYPIDDYATRAIKDKRMRDRKLGEFIAKALDADWAGKERDRLIEFGLCRDEFSSATNFISRIPYWREGIRLEAVRMTTQRDCQIDNTKEDSIGVMPYSIDMHQCAYLQSNTNPSSQILREGISDPAVSRQIHPNGAAISYRSLLPLPGICTNMLVIVCAGYTHVGWGSGRITDAIIQQGEAAGCALAMSWLTGTPVHSIDTAVLRARLISDGCNVDPKPKPEGDEEDPDAGEDGGGGG